MDKKDVYNVTDLAVPFDVECDMSSRMIPMRDGVRLHSVIYFPLKRPERTGVVLIRTPYCRTTWFQLPVAEALQHRQIVMIQSCRGTAWSEGDWDPADTELEFRDAEDTFAYLEKQDFYNGRCAMTGGSYPGWVQWAAARTGYEGLVALTPNVSPLTGCVGAAVRGGGVQLSFAVNWMLSMYHRRRYGYAGVPDYNAMKTVWHTPVIDCDHAAAYPDVPAFRHFLRCADAPHHQLTAHQTHFSRMKVPALISGGWFDGFLPDTIESFQRMQSQAASEKARNFSRLVIGPWGHGGLLNPELFGVRNDRSQVIRWEVRFMYGLLRHPDRDPLPGKSAVHYFMIGENRWRDSECWPPAGTQEQRWYLHSDGNANTASGDGSITESVPGVETPDCFVSDPAHPVLSNRGAHDSLGCYDRREEETRSDVLVYTMPVRKKTLAVTGPVRLRFHAAVSAPDTDFVVHLLDVTPDGRALWLTRGVLRARYRNGTEKPELLVPNRITEFEVVLNDIAAAFLPGHALRIELCGQDFPTCGRNPNTGNEYTTDPELRCAAVTVYHDAEHPAELLLPVLP